jgi:hypothetical protein
MASAVEISNIALIGLGADPISSFTESKTEAIAVNACWNVVRQTLLRSHYWNFAIKRLELARSTNTPGFAYTYKYALPSDNLRIIQVYTDGDYKLENGYIITNQERCQVKYIADITDTSVWSGDFTDLMAARLKAELAYALTRDKDMVTLYWKLFEVKNEQCKWADASEDIEDAFLGGTDLIGVRY